MTQLFANVLKEFSTISNVLENGKIKFIIVIIIIIIVVKNSEKNSLCLKIILLMF